MDRGGKLTLVTRSTNDKFSIQIQDNGHGISKVNLKRIFKPFFTNKPGGLGLGLAATYDILRANHIGIKAESEVGKGTSFVLSFDKDQSR
jgi:signal transduction histidine kinase